MLVHAANMAAVPRLSVQRICHWGIWKGMRKRKIKPPSCYIQLSSGARNKWQLKDNNRLRLIWVMHVWIISTGFPLRHAAAINSKALTCNGFLNESIISWLSYRIQWEHAEGHLEAVSGRMKSLFTHEIKHHISQNASGTALLTVLPLKAWMSPTVMISSAPPLPPVNSCYCPETSPQKCGPWNIFRANENRYT